MMMMMMIKEKGQTGRGDQMCVAVYGRERGGGREGSSAQFSRESAEYSLVMTTVPSFSYQYIYREMLMEKE